MYENLMNVKYCEAPAQIAGYREHIEWDWEGNTDLSGWAINPFTISSPDLIIITDFSGTVIGTTACNIARNDIEEAYKNKNVLFSGWKTHIPKIPQRKKIQELKVYAYIKEQNSAFLLQNYTPPINEEIKKIEDDLWLNAAGVQSPDKTVPYYSCKSIEGGLFFFPNHEMQMCCVVNLNSSDPYNRIFLGETNLKKIPVDKLLQKRKEVIIENQNDGYFACKGCLELRNRMWPPRGFLYNYFNICLDYSCNLRCKFCGLKGIQSPSTPTDEVLRVIELLESRKLLSKNTEVAISGGEPAITDGLDKLLAFLGKRDFSVIIYSNGTIFRQSISDALKNGKTKLIVSVDSASEEVYKSIKGKSVCRQVWSNIEKYAKINPDLVQPKMIILEENKHETESFIQRCVQANVNGVMFDYDNNIEPNIEIIRALKEFDQHCINYKINRYPTRNNIRVLIDSNKI
jgi:organic radical activating enzyme